MKAKFSFMGLTFVVEGFPQDDDQPQIDSLTVDGCDAMFLLQSVHEGDLIDAIDRALWNKWQDEAEVMRAEARWVPSYYCYGE